MSIVKTQVDTTEGKKRETVQGKKKKFKRKNTGMLIHARPVTNRRNPIKKVSLQWEKQPKTNQL